ncbi:MAG: hypothetical protein GXP39_15485 [Chloroflexi bacterium]|nr:hypothetical protein [Chloroflexota bacterium]
MVDLVRMLIRIGNALLDSLAGMIVREFLQPLEIEPAFSSGCIWGGMVALVVGFIARQFLYWWGSIQRYFLPRKPSLDPGPSPAAMTWGCTKSVLGLLIILAFLLILAYKIMKLSGGSI